MKIHFAAKLKALREEDEKTQAELAKALHVSQSTIAKWENGDLEPSLLSFAQICHHFGVSADELLAAEV